MKFNRVLPTLALAVILSLLMIAIPATPALATVGSISIDHTNGPTGTVVSITGSVFTPGSTYTVLFNTTSVATGLIAADATFTTTFPVPTSPRGPHSVTVTTDAPDTSNVLSFIVTPQITLSPSSGYVGDQLSVNGTGFDASSTVTIYFDTASVGTPTTDTSGSFSNATFTTPESYKGSHTVKGSDATGDSPSVTFTTSTKITVTPDSGAIGDIVTISGTGFAASSTITFYFDNITSGATTTTNTEGSFTNNTFTIPSTSRGSHTIKTEDASANSATATFTTAQNISITPTEGAPGTTVTVTGAGFTPIMPIIIKYNGVRVTTNPTDISTDDSGSFNASFSVPTYDIDTYPVEASDSTYSATADFTIWPVAFSSSPTSGNVGTEITVSGFGLIASGTVIITYDGTQVATGSITATGTFSVTFTAPSSTAGDHTITATDGTNTATSTFTITTGSTPTTDSTPPPTPSPLLPIMGGKTKSKAHFDWEDVTDPSTPVTYNLQIASDINFTTIVLDKAGLTTSEYTLTAEEKLEPTTEGTLYYWRVKAIDGASNASGWTGAGIFHVGAAFGLTGPILYVVIIVGYLLLFSLCFWISRRGAHY